MEWFENIEFVNLVKSKLPKLFRLAELETMRGGKIGMEVGVLRERILTAFIIKCFGKENVKSDFSSTENSKDVKVFEDVLSIKTFTNNGFGGVKVFWASDNESVKKAVENYRPQNHLLISNIKWGKTDNGIFLIPLDVQNEILEHNGILKYLKINTGNNRGISFHTETFKSLLSHPNTKKIQIDWNLPILNFDVYDRWIQEIG